MLSSWLNRRRSSSTAIFAPTQIVTVPTDPSLLQYLTFRHPGIQCVEFTPIYNSDSHVSKKVA
jgi:hypothetical protein